MSKQLLELALNNVLEMTRALEQAKDKDAASPHLARMNVIHTALLEAQKALADNDILTARIAAAAHVAKSCPAVIMSAHAIDAQIIRHTPNTVQGVNDLTNMLEQVARVTVTSCVNSLLSEAGKNGGFILEAPPHQNILKVHYRIGVHSPCEGLTDLDGLLKQFAAEIQKLRR